MAKQMSKGIDKEAMFKKIMPSAASQTSTAGFDALDSFDLEDEGFVPARSKKSAPKQIRPENLQEMDLDALNLFEQEGISFDPLDSFDLLEDTPAPKRQRAAKPASAKPPARQQSARPKRTVQSVKQAGVFPIDTAVLQNPAAPTAHIPAPPIAPQPVYVESQAVLAAPAAPTAPVSPPVSSQPASYAAYSPWNYPSSENNPATPAGYGAAPEQNYSVPPAGMPAYPAAPPFSYPYPPAYYPPAPPPARVSSAHYEPSLPSEPVFTAEQLAPLNLTQVLLERQLEPVIERLHGCNCDCCRTQIALLALDKLPVKYMLAGELTEENLFDRRSVAQVATALCQATLFAKAHPQH